LGNICVCGQRDK